MWRQSLRHWNPSAVSGDAHVVDRDVVRRDVKPVTERLPNRGEWVLAYGPHYSHIVAECDRGEWRSVYRDSETGEPWLREAGMVTHWMPLPAPPADGK